MGGPLEPSAPSSARRPHRRRVLLVAGAGRLERARNAAHFGASAASYETWEYAGSAATALDQLTAQLDVWLAGVRGLGEAGLLVPIGAKEPFPEAPMADLVLHIQRELIHHLSEVCLLRDLYLHTKPGTSKGDS